MHIKKYIKNKSINILYISRHLQSTGYPKNCLNSVFFLVKPVYESFVIKHNLNWEKRHHQISCHQWETILCNISVYFTLLLTKNNPIKYDLDGRTLSFVQLFIYKYKYKMNKCFWIICEKDSQDNPI